jgi:hypothetical protein
MIMDIPTNSEPQIPSKLHDTDQTRATAKAALRDALSAYEGEPHHTEVAQKIADLVALNPVPAPALAEELRDGDWTLISAPSFPDGERRPDGTYCYTLGRLAFNMFQPRDLKVVINRVSQPVLPIAKGKQRSHDIVVEFTTVSKDTPTLRGIVRNLGVCQPEGDDKLRVQFTGGSLEPASGTDLAAWKQVFEHPERPPRGSLKEWWQNLMLRLMFGLVPPQGMDPDTGRTEFQMKRSPKGSLTILYLDEELRITRGQKETILVCERSS